MLHAYNPPSRYLPYLSWTEIAALPDKANTVIVLPTGATEQHGPHLPCSVDTTISAGVVGHALARLPDHVPAYAMAPITYGKSEEHLHFPGTMTLTGETLLATMNEIGESVYRAGFRKLLIVNGHGGQPQVMEISARELRLRDPQAAARRSADERGLRQRGRRGLAGGPAGTGRASRAGKAAMVAAAFDERLMGAPVVTGGGGIGIQDATPSVKNTSVSPGCQAISVWGRLPCVVNAKQRPGAGCSAATNAAQLAWRRTVAYSW